MEAIVGLIIGILIAAVAIAAVGFVLALVLATLPGGAAAIGS